MADFKRFYLTVTMDIMPNGLNLSCWMSAEEFFLSEIAHYPYNYVYVGEFCTWQIHANMELTSKVVSMVGEQADRICIDSEKRNKLRKIDNRR